MTIIVRTLHSMRKETRPRILTHRVWAQMEMFMFVNPIALDGWLPHAYCFEGCGVSMALQIIFKIVCVQENGAGICSYIVHKVT